MSTRSPEENPPNPEPFMIWKNARQSMKRQERARKQSEQCSVTVKKPRKMTIEVSQLQSGEVFSPQRGRSCSMEGEQLSNPFSAPSWAFSGSIG